MKFQLFLNLSLSLSLSLSFSLLIVSCNDTIQDSIDPLQQVPCHEALESWDITSSDFPSMPKQKDLQFLNDEIGYSVGNNATINKTTDGGQSWQRLHFNSDSNGYNKDAVTDVILNTVWFVNESVGYAGGDREADFHHTVYSDGVLLKTTNGGITWNKIYVSGTREVKDVVFYDEQNGIGLFRLLEPINGTSYQVKTTRDGGNTWMGTSLVINRLLENNLITTQSRAMVLTMDENEHPMLWSTYDKGETWESTILPVSHYAEVYFIDDHHVIADFLSVNFEQSLFKSSDGGNTWTEFETPFFRQDVIHFFNSQEGFIINGTYEADTSGWETWLFLTGYESFQTTDGGITWTKKVLEADCNMEGLQFAPSRNLLFTLNRNVNRFEKR